MQGFVQRRIPVWVRRTVTMIPAFIVVLVGINPTETLVHLTGRAFLRDPVRPRPARLVHRPP